MFEINLDLTTVELMLWLKTYNNFFTIDVSYCSNGEPFQPAND